MRKQTCRTCNKEKPLSKFTKEKRNKNGVTSRCKACRNASLSKNTRKYYVGRTKRECIACGIIKTFDHFAKEPRSKTGIRARCKECRQQYREPIPHKAFHRLKAKQKLYDIPIETTKEEVALLFEAFEGRCAYCNVEESAETGTFHLEHIIPMSRPNARHHVSNFAIACGKCNAKKHNRPLIEFYRMHQPFTGAMLEFIFIYVARFNGRTPEEVAKSFYAEVEDDEQT